MGYSSGGCGGRRVSKNRMQNRHQQHCRSSSSKTRNSFFREEQTDLLNVFQGQLLEVNPPSYNPEYVGNLPSHNPTPRYVSSSSFDDEAFQALDQSPSGHPHHCHRQRRSSNNPFEDDASESNRNSAAFQQQALPVASVVAISDTEEEEIPFVSVLPIQENGSDDHKIRVVSESSLPRPTMVQPPPQNLPARPATRAARPQAQFPQWRQHQEQRNEIPAWLVLNPSAQRTIHTNVANSRCGTRTQKRWCGSNPQRCGGGSNNKFAPPTRRHSAFSRMSVRTRAAAGEARRKVNKNFGTEAEPYYSGCFRR